MVASTFGCSSQEIDLFLGFPHLEEAASVVLAVPKNDEVDLYAAPLVDSSLRVVFDFDTDRNDLIEALVFEKTLDELGLTEGPLERPVDGDDIGELQALEPIGSFRAEIDRDADTAVWVDDAATAARAARYKKKASVCATFTSPARLGTIPGSLTFAVPIDEGHALLGTRDGVLAIASLAGLTVIDPPFTGYVRSAFAGGGKIYLSEWFSPRVYRADPSPTEGMTNLERLPDSPLTDGAAVMAGGGGTILAATDAGEAAWFDGTTWTSLPTIGNNDDRLRASWTPEEAFYWGRASGALTRVDPNGGVASETLDSGGGVFSLEAIDEIGTVIGTGDGTFLRRTGNSWGNLGGDYGWWALDLEPYAGGFFFLLASGTVGQYRDDPDNPLCRDQSLLGFINDGQLVRLGDHLLAAGWDSNLPTEVVIVEF